MFWLHRHLLTKSALNSKLTAKWLSDWYDTDTDGTDKMSVDII